MRGAAAILLPACVLACVLTGCGAAGRPSQATPSGTTTPRQAPDGLRIGVVGDLQVQVPGAVVERGRLADIVGDPLVLVSADAPLAARVGALAAAHPVTHFALVGASESGRHLANLAGLVLAADQAARLGGVVAGLVAADQATSDARVAWVGPVESPLAAAFTRGVHEIAPGRTVLRVWSHDTPAACKEAALGAIDRGAVVIMAHGGTCALGAIGGAHEQNHVGLEISDFELPSIAADQVVRDAVEGVYHGGEDLVFGSASGAVAVSFLDPRISPAIAVRARTAAQQLASGLPPSG